MYIHDHQLKGPEPKPITSGPEFEAEMEEYNSSPGFRNVFGGYPDEGAPQYFTDVVLVEQGLGKMATHLYRDQLRCFTARVVEAMAEADASKKAKDLRAIVGAMGTQVGS
jgi:hypothetical protein